MKRPNPRRFAIFNHASGFKPETMVILETVTGGHVRIPNEIVDRLKEEPAVVAAETSKEAKKLGRWAANEVAKRRKEMESK